MATADEIVSIIKDISLKRLIDYVSISDLQVRPISHSRLVLGHWTTFILITCSDSRIIFKTHFFTEKIRIFSKIPLQNCFTSFNDSLAIDFMKEYCNLAGVTIKRILEDQMIECGISLPMCIRGFDNIFFQSQGIGMSWSIENAETHLNLQALIESRYGNPLDHLNVEKAINKLNEVSEFEFL